MSDHDPWSESNVRGTVSSSAGSTGGISPVHESGNPFRYKWEAAVFLVPGLAAFVLGLGLGNLGGFGPGLGTVFMCIWWSIVLASGIRIVRQQEFLLIERFGRYHDVKFVGIRFLLLSGVIDHVHFRDSFAAKEIDLYEDEGSNEIDFQDGSAPIDASAWYTIGNPAFYGTGSDLLKVQIRNYVYQVGNRLKRIAQIFEGALKPKLESLTLAQAKSNAGDVAAKDAAAEAAKDFTAMGVFPRAEKPIIVHDIDLPEEIQKLNELQLKGEMEATEAVNRSRGYFEPVKVIAKELGITNQEAMAYLLDNKGLEVVSQTGANISFVSPDTGGVLKTLNVGKKG